MNLLDQLTQEHQDYVLKLTTLAEVIEGIRVNGRGGYFIKTVDELVQSFTVELEEHANREEDFLFPRLIERAPDSPVALMIEEHQMIRALSGEFGQWYPIWRAGDDEAYGRWASPALDLRGKFSTHMQKENLMLFPLARRVLTATEIDQLTVLKGQ